MPYPDPDAKRFGVVVPSTNTVFECDLHGFHVASVSHHVARIETPDVEINSDAAFERLIEQSQVAMEEAVDRLVAIRPDRLIFGTSAHSIWNGRAGCQAMREAFAARAGCPVTLGADACIDALNAVGARSIAMLTPYASIADTRAKHFFEESGFAVPRIMSMNCATPTQIAAVTSEAMLATVDRLDGDDVDVILQFGTNLPFARLADTAQQRRGKPVIAVNAAIYRHALRESGLEA